MAEQNFDEKREYVRADLTTQVRIQPVSREEFERLKTMQTGGSLDDTCPDGSNVSKDQFGHLIQRLIRIEEKVDKIRGIMPGASITADVIAGFPGETDEDFERLLT